MTDNTKIETDIQKYEVSPLELFFDLVFVFAVSQLSRHLINNLSLRGAAETLVMLLAVFTVWFTTSWSATIIRADQSRTLRLVLAVMLLGLFMNASVTMAFSTSSREFAIPLLLIQLGRTIWTMVNSADKVFREHYFRTLIWVIATAPLWIAGTAVNPEHRLLFWASAAGIDQIGRLLAHPVPGRRLRSENVVFDADHMLERCRLFLLIALGETVFTSGTAIAAAPAAVMTLITGTSALAGTVALWSLSFGRSHRLIIRHMEKTRDPILISRHAVNTLTVMVAGLICSAVANSIVIANPYGYTTVAVSLLLIGGPVLFLIAQGWYLRRVPGIWTSLHLYGVILLIITGLVVSAVQVYQALLLAGVILTVIALIDRNSK